MAFPETSPKPSSELPLLLLSQFWYMSHFSRGSSLTIPCPSTSVCFLLLFSLTASCSFLHGIYPNFVIKYLSVWLLFHVTFLQLSCNLPKSRGLNLDLSTAVISLQHIVGAWYLMTKGKCIHIPLHLLLGKNEKQGQGQTYSCIGPLGT